MAKYKKIYLFDLGGDLINSFDGRLKLSEFLNISIRVVDSAIIRNSIVDRKYYISYKKDFTIPKSKYSHNPIFSKNPYKYKGEGSLLNDFLTDDL